VEGLNFEGLESQDTQVAGGRQALFGTVARETPGHTDCSFIKGFQHPAFRTPLVPASGCSE
jgi:hypothetical protein